MSKNPDKMQAGQTCCGFASIIGLPNAGKSTLMNALVGAKVSIVSKRAQTTRTRVLGIAMHENAQIILLDTPGIFAARKSFEQFMVGAAFEALDEAELTIHLVDAGQKGALAQNQMIIDKLRADSKPCLLVLNKTDKIQKPDLLALAAAFNAAYPYEATFMISALKQAGTQDLLSDLARRMKPGPFLHEEDQITDMPLRLMAAEITREKIFEQLYRELPHAALVETESWETFDNGDIKISQAVIVQRDSQKAIVLGKGGSRIKQIGAASRLELEKLLETRVHLKLFVKVEPNWMERPDLLRLQE